MSAIPYRCATTYPPAKYTAAIVSDTPTSPINLPAISSNGDTDPSSTSAIRCPFSSTTPCIAGVAPTMMTMNIRPMSMAGRKKFASCAPSSASSYFPVGVNFVSA